MCNACGFYCCAYDGFSGCGCDHCPNRNCWSDDDFEEEYEDTDDGFYCDAVDPAQSTGDLIPWLRVAAKNGGHFIEAVQQKA